MTDDLSARLLELLEQHEPMALATVVSSHEAPGVAVGAKLIVLADGTREGSLGSVAIDDAVVRAALDQIPRESVAVARLSPAGEELPTRRALRDVTREPAVDVSIEPMVPPPHVIIVGAGHIAVPLARLAKVLDYRVTVIDDRAQFASRERFPDADAVIADDFQRAVAAQKLNGWTYLVLVTRGHEHDEGTLQQVIHSHVPYIGMIGSRRRVLVVFQRLTKLGISDTLLDRVYAPVGLDIGARTPEEIALAILAEIVNVRRGGNARSLALRQRLKRGEAVEPK